ncbi:MAG TPA: acyl-CoA dehydrogenase family protein [Frankiaceae bacterium]|jgi:acyl-CoA dehydrogenase|nr:acyl-CoA dehydrogenase family protein [Frankiaceae bacterium]
MNFTLDESQAAVRELAAKIFADKANPERQRELEAAGEAFDGRLWSDLATAGLLGIGLPEEYGGGGLGFVEVGLLLTEAGRRAAKLPLLSTLTTAAALAEFGPAELAKQWLPKVADGSAVLSAALATFPDPPLTVNASGTLDGVASFVPSGMDADAILVFAGAPGAGSSAYLIDPAAAGVSRERQVTTAGAVEARVTLSGVQPLAPLDGDGAQVREWLREHVVAGLCAMAAGITAAALDLTTAYAREREQFGKPIAAFQAVAQRAADAFIDVKAIRLTALQACWRVASGLPAGEQVAVAKFWAADGGKRVMHAAQHIHGGIGVDKDYPLHRLFLSYTATELSLGGATEQLLLLSDELASA